MPNNNPISPEALRALQEYIANNPQALSNQSASGLPQYNETRDITPQDVKGRPGGTTIFDAEFTNGRNQPFGGTTIFDTQQMQGQYSGVEDVMKDYHAGNIDDTQLDKILQGKNYSGQGDTQRGLGNNRIGDDGTLYSDNMSKYEDSRGRGFIENLGAAGQGVSDILGGFRKGLSIYGAHNRGKYIDDYYNERRGNQEYTPNPQTANSNYKGGFSFEDGGRYGEEDWFETNGRVEGDTPALFQNPIGGDFSDKRGFLNSAILASRQNKENRNLEDNPYARIKLGSFRGQADKLRKFGDGGPYGEEGRYGYNSKSEKEKAEGTYISPIHENTSTGLGAYGYTSQAEKEAAMNFDTPIITPPITSNMNDSDLNTLLLSSKEGMGVLRAAKAAKQTPSDYMRTNSISSNKFHFQNGGPMISDMSPSVSPVYKEGEYITFEHGGKTYSGTIKKNENGKIYI